MASLRVLRRGARRAGLLALTLLLASLTVFLALSVLPGDPAQVILGVGATPESLAALRQQLGTDLPLPARYLAWLGDVLRGDLGVSATYAEPVSALIAERAAVSVPLALMAMTVSVVLGVMAGTVAAANGGRTDLGVMALTQLGVAVPNFWLAILLILVFAVTLGWFPAGGFPGWDEGLWPCLRALLLPALALGLPQAAILARVTRSAVIEASGQEWVLTARAKGLSFARTVWRHALPNAMIPVVTVMGLQMAFLISGAIVIENVFYLPGVGRLLFQAIAQRDLITVQGTVLLIVVTVIAINFVVDLAYLWLDPRLRAS